MARVGQKLRQWLRGYGQNPGEKCQWFGPGSRVTVVAVVVKFWTYCVGKAKRICSGNGRRKAEHKRERKIKNSKMQRQTFIYFNN